jgi:hypothetical protein
VAWSGCSLCRCASSDTARVNVLTVRMGTREPPRWSQNRPAYPCWLVLVDSVHPQPVGEALAAQQHARAVTLASARCQVPAAVPILVRGAAVVNVTGTEAATPNGTPPSITRVPAE